MQNQPSHLSLSTHLSVNETTKRIHKLNCSVTTRLSPPLHSSTAPAVQYEQCYSVNVQAHTVQFHLSICSKASASPTQECNGFSPPTSLPLAPSFFHTHTHTHSTRGANHRRLFSGPVCEWDFYGRGGGRHRCICRHAAATPEKHHHPILIFSSRYLKYLSHFLSAALSS